MWKAFQVEPASKKSTQKRGQKSATTNNANPDIIDVLKNNDNIIKFLPLKLALTTNSPARIICL